MKRNSFIARVAAVAAVAFLALPGFAAQGSFPFHEVNVLGTSMDLTVVSDGKTSAEAARAAVLAEVDRLAKLLSTYESGTELSRLNAARLGEAVKVSPEVLEVLGLYETWREKTGGTYSAGVGTLVQLWKEAEKVGQEPSPEVLAARVKIASGKLWEADRAAGTVKRLTEAPLNVDSLGKGFIVSRAAALAMKVKGVSGVLLNIGGDITATGTSEPGKQLKWSIKVADPRNAAGRAISEIRLTNMSVATSGSYERGYTIGEKRYSHVLDVKTGRPVEIASRTGRQVLGATVIAPDNATANALATSLCVLSVEEGLELVKGVKGAGCLLVLADGSRVRSELFKRHEAPRDDAPLDQSTIATADGPRWPVGHAVKVNFDLKPLESRPAERAYVAVWVEDANGQHVTTVAVWGNNRRWLQTMKGWWKHGKADEQLVSATTRATRPAGKYEIQWDGRDKEGRAVPAGKYTVWVETSYEHGGHVLRSASVACSGEPQVAEIGTSNHYEKIQVEFGPVRSDVRVGMNGK